MGFYSDTPWTSANMWNLSSMTTVGNVIHPRVSLMRRSTLEYELDSYTDSANR